MDEFSDLVRTVNIVKCHGKEDCRGVKGSECHQEYTENKWVAYDERNGLLVVDDFKFPSACKVKTF